MTRKLCYTIGNAAGYLRTLAREGEIIKTERGGDPEQINYPGGSIWETFEAAQAEIERRRLDIGGYVVFGIFCDWETETAPNADPDASWRDLLVARPVIVLAKSDFGAPFTDYRLAWFFALKVFLAAWGELIGLGKGGLAAVDACSGMELAESIRARMNNIHAGINQQLDRAESVARERGFILRDMLNDVSGWSHVHSNKAVMCCSYCGGEDREAESIKHREGCPVGRTIALRLDTPTK